MQLSYWYFPIWLILNLGDFNIGIIIFIKKIILNENDKL